MVACPTQKLWIRWKFDIGLALAGLKSGERLKGRATGVIAVLDTALLISEIGWPHGYVSGPLLNPQHEGAKSNRLIALSDALV